METYKKYIFEAMFGFFLRKSSTLIELHSIEITKSKMLKTTSGEWFHFSRAQHLTHRIFRIYSNYLNFLEFQTSLSPRYPHSNYSTFPPNSGHSSLALQTQHRIGLDFKHV